MKIKSLREVMDMIELHLIARFGVPKELRVDKRNEFSG